jgi:hypothetical protein
LQHLSKSCQDSCQGLDRDQQKYWESLTGLKQTKGFFQGPSARRTKKLLQINRNHLWWVIGLLTGHCHLTGHLFKIGLMDRPVCERCLEKDESATHILCDLEAIDYLRFCHLGHYLLEPGDYQDTPVRSYTSFKVKECWRAETEGDAQQITEGCSARAGLGLPHTHSFSHSTCSKESSGKSCLILWSFTSKC